MSSLPFAVLYSALLSTALPISLSAASDDHSPDGEVIADAYALPAELVELGDGRTLNLRCSGEGAPVIMLESGGNADSTTWYRVQSRLARLSRVCAYDRAGYGFSDEGPYPRDLDADVADLRALIRAAGIPAPLLLVGHSKGSNIVRKYAQLHPEGIVGMVLIDPPEHGSDDLMPKDWQTQIASMLAQREELLSACERAAEAGNAEFIQHNCLRAAPRWMSEQVMAATTRNKSKPSYWRTLRSELTHNVKLFAEPVPADESYGSIPLVALTAATQDENVPDEVRAVIEAKRRDTHARILAASTDSNVIEVSNSSHDMQLDQPGAIASAVQNLLGPQAWGDGPAPGRHEDSPH